jgi:hypothetical protein
MVAYGRWWLMEDGGLWEMLLMEDNGLWKIMAYGR